jgi:hypothetical protein
MADDDREATPLFDPRLFTPTEFLGEDMEHNVDVTGDTSVEVNHTLDLDLPMRRIEAGVICFAVLVVALGVLTGFGPTVQVSAALGAVVVGNVLLRAVGR